MVFQSINPLRCAALLSVLATLRGCAALAPLQPPVRPVDMPLAWSGAEMAGAQLAVVDDASLVQWWDRFGDAQLAALVRAALQSNTSVNAAQAAQAALQQAQAAAVPDRGRGP